MTEISGPQANRPRIILTRPTPAPSPTPPPSDTEIFFITGYPLDPGPPPKATLRPPPDTGFASGQKKRRRVKVAVGTRGDRPRAAGQATAEAGSSGEAISASADPPASTGEVRSTGEETSAGGVSPTTTVQPAAQADARSP